MKSKESDFERSVERTRTYVTERAKLLDTAIRSIFIYRKRNIEMKSKEECVGEISNVLVVRDVEPTRSDAAIRSIVRFQQQRMRSPPMHSQQQSAHQSA